MHGISLHETRFGVRKKDGERVLLKVIFKSSLEHQASRTDYGQGLWAVDSKFEKIIPP